MVKKLVKRTLSCELSLLMPFFIIIYGELLDSFCFRFARYCFVSQVFRACQRVVIQMTSLVVIIMSNHSLRYH